MTKFLIKNEDKGRMTGHSFYAATCVDLYRAGLPADDWRKADEMSCVELDESLFDATFMWRINEEQVMAILVEKCDCDGYTKSGIQELFHEMDRLGMDTDGQLLPVLVDAEHSDAFGFIAMPAAEELLSYEVGPGSDFAQEAAAIMNDMALETPDCLYEFAGVKTKLYRD